MGTLSKAVPMLEPASAGISILGNLVNILRYFIPKFIYRNDYYFEEVNKKVFIKKNGNGIVMCSCDLYVIRPEKVNDFIRTFDISDGKKDVKFPSLKSMQRKNIKFFEEYGFWYKSENDIITSIEENYDDAALLQSARDNIDKRKMLGVRFIVDKNKLKPKHRYRFIYGYSVPGLFPIRDGKHDTNEYSRKTYGKYVSSMSVKHMSKKMRFAIYLENGIQLKEAPSGHAIKVSNNQQTPSDICDVRDNILYTKYLYEVKRPEKYSAIQIQWNLK